MKALLFSKYGSPEDVLQMEAIAKPIPKESEILIKIYATTVNDYDWSLVRGKPYLYRLMFGISKPKNQIPGMELSGIIEEVGAKVDKWSVGDEVLGDISDYGFGTFAEYICINENAIVKKPKEISFEQATALPHASTLAWQALKELGGISQGQHILINGGGGGVGTLGLQLAKMFDCHVTGVDSEAKLSMMTAIGFDEVIDYRTVDFTKTGKQYDLILDCKTTRPALSYLRALNTSGKYVSIGGKASKLLGLVFWSKIIPHFSTKKLSMLALKTNKGLEYILDLAVQKKLVCEIDGPYALEESSRLIQYFGEGLHKGKVVVRCHSSSDNALNT